MKQAKTEDDHPGEGLRTIPAAPAVLGGTGAVTLTGNASSFVPMTTNASKGRWVAALVAVAVVAGVGGHFLSSSNQKPSSIGAGTASAALWLPGNGAQKPADPHGAPTLVTVKIAATPADTEILLDGAKLDGNPFSGQFPKDPALHRLELRCLGRRTEARMINLDQDLDLLIALEPDTARPLRAAAPGAAALKAGTGKHASEAPSASSPSGTLSHKTRTDSARPIDDSDPYAN